MKTIVLVVALALGLSGCASKALMSATDPDLYDLSMSCDIYVTHTPRWSTLYGRTIHYGPFAGLYMMSLDSVHAEMVEDCRQYRTMKYGPTVKDAPSQAEVQQLEWNREVRKARGGS
jgi:uncharacterized protein YceK